MAEIAFRHGILALAMSGLLAGCVETAGGGLAPFAPAAAAKAGADVEAPEVFQVTDTALWDGRPSLGGIWVASPDAVDPERVVMENLSTGTIVEGALFRRERDNPGPALQISSDAAEALGILAGQPVEIRVTALRRAEPEVPVQAEIPPTDPAADPATDAPEAAVAEGTAAPESAPEAGPETADAEATAAATAAALAATDGTAAATDPALAEAGTDPAAEAPPKTAKERRAEAKAAREAKKAAKAAAAAEAEAAAAAGATVDSAGVAAVETAPLDARAPEVSAAAAAAAVDAPEATDTTDAAAPAEAAPAADAAAPAVIAEEAPATTARPIQIASFLVEANATRAVADLAKIGVTAQVRKTEVGGKPVWGIMATGDVAMLKSIRGAGYPDAYFLQ